MRKRIITALTALVMAGAMSITAFAGQWKQDTSGWWYENDDGSFPNSGWNWIDGKCYYFNSEGYCLQNTQTPDGYTVDDSGAWIIDGVIQTQETAETASQASDNSMQIDTINFTVPSGFTFSYSDEGAYYFTNADYNNVIGIISEVIPEMETYGSLLDQYQGTILDMAMEEAMGTPQVKSTNQFTSGTWYSYIYTDASSIGVPGSLKAYARLSGGRVQIVVFAGMISSLDTDTIMNTCVR